MKAQFYFSNIPLNSASAQLLRYIKLSDSVLPKLQSLGYKLGNCLLTPAHVKVIVDKFGRLDAFKQAQNL